MGGGGRVVDGVRGCLKAAQNGHIWSTFVFVGLRLIYGLKVQYLKNKMSVFWKISTTALLGSSKVYLSRLQAQLLWPSWVSYP